MTNMNRLLFGGGQSADALEQVAPGSLRSKVGAAKGLPPKMWDRLRGDDEDTLAADADDLLAELDALAGHRAAPSFDGGVRRSVPEPFNTAFRRWLK